MKNFKYLIGFFLLGWTTQVFSQDMFWNFDDLQNPLTIPAECDAKFDEIRGGVFMPNIDEMYEYGMAFLKNSALSVQQQGAYCLLGAALQGDPRAQLEMAKLYEEGRVLPQDDLSAYKWAFIAALNGNKPAERMTLSLEQYLTTADMEKTSAAIQETRMQIQRTLEEKLKEEHLLTTENKEKLHQMHSEIRAQFGDKNNAALPEPTVEEEGPSPEDLQVTNSNLSAVFTESDRMQ